LQKIWRRSWKKMSFNFDGLAGTSFIGSAGLSSLLFPVLDTSIFGVVFYQITSRWLPYAHQSKRLLVVVAFPLAPFLFDCKGSSRNIITSYNLPWPGIYSLVEFIHVPAQQAYTAFCLSTSLTGLLKHAIKFFYLIQYVTSKNSIENPLLVYLV
jgi:hypothetical protein